MCVPIRLTLPSLPSLAQGAIVVAVLAMLATAAYVSAMPVGDSCLTPEQKRELVTITNDIKV